MSARTYILGSARSRPAPRLPIIVDRIATWIQIARERAHLARLDPAMLRDIGLSESEAAQESSRPFWDTTLR